MKRSASTPARCCSSRPGSAPMGRAAYSKPSASKPDAFQRKVHRNRSSMQIRCSNSLPANGGSHESPDHPGSGRHSRSSLPPFAGRFPHVRPHSGRNPSVTNDRRGLNNAAFRWLSLSKPVAKESFDKPDQRRSAVPRRAVVTHGQVASRRRTRTKRLGSATIGRHHCPWPGWPCHRRRRDSQDRWRSERRSKPELRSAKRPASAHLWGQQTRTSASAATAGWPGPTKSGRLHGPQPSSDVSILTDRPRYWRVATSGFSPVIIAFTYLISAIGRTVDRPVLGGIGMHLQQRNRRVVPALLGNQASAYGFHNSSISVASRVTEAVPAIER